MFTPEERERLRDQLLAAARADTRITGAALTGSASVNREDCWSDIDLAFGVAADLEQTIIDWTDRLYAECGAISHMDMTRGRTVYRVFLLDNTLQVDLAFAPEEEFGALAPTFKLLFGDSADLLPPSPQNPQNLIAWGWLYALHARSSVKRGKVWQAEYMISGMRDHVLALACIRHKLPAAEGRGIDALPSEVTTAISEALVVALNVESLTRAFRVTTESLIVEIGHVDSELGDRLAGPLRELAN